MKYGNHYPTNQFPNSLPSYMFFPHITQRPRIRYSSETLIDNIFSLIENTVSDNLTVTISDNLPRFVILSNIFTNPQFNKSNNYERDWSNFL